MPLANTLVADWVEFNNQLFFSLGVVGCYFVNPTCRPLSGNTSVVPIVMGQKSAPNVSAADINPSVGLEKPINTHLP